MLIAHTLFYYIDVFRTFLVFRFVAKCTFKKFDAAYTNITAKKCLEIDQSFDRLIVEVFLFFIQV